MQMIFSNSRRATTLMAVTAAVMALFLVLASTAEAAPGGNGKGKGPDKTTAGNSQGSGQDSSALSIIEEGPYNYGDQIHFAVSTTKTDYPWVRVTCFQGGELVYSQSHGIYESYDFEQTFTLGPTGRWTGGDASCNADLIQWVNGDARTITSLAFGVQG